MRVRFLLSKFVLSLLLLSVAHPIAAESITDKLSKLGAFKQAEFLPVDDAFQLTLGEVDATHFRANFTIQDGYYLYRDKIVFHAQDDRKLDIALPVGVVKADPYFGEVAILKRNFSAPVTVGGARGGEQQVRATYQGCAEDGICYAPVSKNFTLTLPSIISSARADVATDNNTKLLHADTLPSLLFGAFIAGLLLTFTPCVLPLLPILSAVIASGGATTKRKSVTLAGTYVLGTMATYAAIGGIAGAAGEQLQAYFQNIWAIGFFALVLFAMALAMFGVFTVQMPSALQSRGREVSARLTGSPVLVFLLGAISALIVGACVSPVLISFLAIAISTGDATLGAAMMTAMAFGMGIPLLALGFGAGHLLPRAGAWMTNINRVFGVLLIAVAIYLLSALPAVPVLFLWGALFIFIALYLGMRVEGSAKLFARGIAVLFLVWGMVALVGGFAGGRDVFQPLAELTQSPIAKTTEQHSTAFIRVDNLAELESQINRARDENKLTLVDYYADWCVDCVRMEQTTFRDAAVIDILEKHFVALQIDVTDPRDKNAQQLKKYFGVFGPPAFLFFDRDGAALPSKRFYGYRNTAEIHSLLTELAR